MSFAEVPVSMVNVVWFLKLSLDNYPWLTERGSAERGDALMFALFLWTPPCPRVMMGLILLHSSQNRYWIIQPTNKIKQNSTSLERTLHWVVWNNLLWFRELLLEQMFPCLYKVFLSVEDKYLKLSRFNVSASLKMSFWQQKTGTMQITGDGREQKLCLSAKHCNAPKF